MKLLLQTKKQFNAQTDEQGYAQIEIDGLKEELAKTNEKMRQILVQAQAEQERFKNEFSRNAENAHQEITILKNLTSTLQEKLNIKTQEVAAKEDERIAVQEHLQSELARISKEFSEQSAKDKSELEALKLQLEAAGTINIAEAESRELRRIDGLYKQLRLQFEEKSNLLDETRRELFHTQEKLTRELMDQKERQYEGSEYERELQRCLDQLEDEQRELADSHRREVEQLQELISQMMCCA